MITPDQDIMPVSSSLPTLLSVRLRKHADYGIVYAASRKHQSTSMSFFYRPSNLPEAGGAVPSRSRFGITVPRVLGPAVLRNRIKRRLRVLARAAIHLLPAGTDVILHPRPAVATMPHEALRAEVEQVFRQVRRRVASDAPNTPLPRQPRRTAGSKGTNKGQAKA